MINILGGIGLIFFGVRFLRKGLDRLFGGQLMIWLSQATKGRFKALLTGVSIGAAAPSSTGASLMTVQMLTSGKMTAQSMLAVLLGTNIGITVAVQLLAFRIQDYAGLLIFLGMMGFQFLRRDRLRGVAQCLLALGVVFLAIDMIGVGAKGMAADPNVREVLHVFASFPWLLLVTTAVLGMLMQSSTASIGMGIAMAAGGLLDAGLLGWWVVGTNLGIGLTSLAAAWGTLDGRRMGIANLSLKLLVAAPLLLVPQWLHDAFTVVPGTVERQTAMFHTNFNIAVAAIGLPLLPWVWKVMQSLLPDQTLDRFAPEASYLDDKALESPSIALARATRECMRMAEHVRFMLEQFVCAYTTRDVALARRVKQEDDAIDKINLSLKNYLARIDEGLAPAEVKWQFALHGIASEMEAIADVIERNLCDIVVKMVNEGIVIDGPEQHVLDEAFRRALFRFELGMGLLTTRDPVAAEAFLSGKEPFYEWLRIAQKEHYQRLSVVNKNELASSATFLDLLNGIKRINSHLSILGYSLASTPPSAWQGDNAAVAQSVQQIEGRPAIG